jgi:hypothetical protein
VRYGLAVVKVRRCRPHCTGNGCLLIHSFDGAKEFAALPDGHPPSAERRPVLSQSSEHHRHWLRYHLNGGTSMSASTATNILGLGASFSGALSNQSRKAFC